MTLQDCGDCGCGQSCGFTDSECVRGCGENPVFLVTTSGIRLRFLVRVYTYLLRRKLQKQNLPLVVQWHCPGHDRSKDPLFRFLKLSRGRPHADDLRSAREFACSLL